MAATSSSARIPHAAATSPKARWRVRSGSTAASRASSSASMSAAVPRYRSEIIFGRPSTQPISRRYQYGFPLITFLYRLAISLGHRISRQKARRHAGLPQARTDRRRTSAHQDRDSQETGARPARLVQPLTGDAGSVVQALAGATFAGPRDDASALTLAVREVRRGPPGRRAVVLITTTPIPAALASDVSGQLRAADASLYVAAVPEVAPLLARLASASGGWAVTASSSRSLMPAVDAIGADLAHQYQLAYATTEPALTATRLRVAVAEGGTTATAEATVRVPASPGSSAPRAQVPAGARGNAGVSVAWLIAAVLLLCLAGAAIVDIRRMWRKPGRSRRARE